MNESIYSKRSNLILGFHGCDKSVADKVIQGEIDLLPSTNDYDWLGSGIYFWENNESRAFDFAVEQFNRGSIKEPAVLGAVIDLGFCMDMTDSNYLDFLKEAYEICAARYKAAKQPLPTNKTLGNSNDKILRRLDCAVIQIAHELAKKYGGQDFDSVKGVFWEGVELYPDAGFREKNHIQLCICNPNCIKGYFLPRDIDKRFPNP